jgi:predicted RNA binding protein YcfA (HicA-like mRNA interferase family)
MTEYRPLKYKDVIKKIRKLGYSFRRATGGSHEIWWHEKSKKTSVIPHHREIKSGTIKSIIKQIGISSNNFYKI